MAITSEGDIQYVPCKHKGRFGRAVALDSRWGKLRSVPMTCLKCKYEAFINQNRLDKL